MNSWHDSPQQHPQRRTRHPDHDGPIVGCEYSPRTRSSAGHRPRWRGCTPNWSGVDRETTRNVGFIALGRRLSGRMRPEGRQEGPGQEVASEVGDGPEIARGRRAELARRARWPRPIRPDGRATGAWRARLTVGSGHHEWAARNSTPVTPVHLERGSRRHDGGVSFPTILTPRPVLTTRGSSCLAGPP